MKLNLVKLLTILLLVINISGSEPIEWTFGQENIIGTPDWFDRTHNRYDPSRMTTGQENIFGTSDWFELHCPSGNLRDCGYADLILPDQTDLV